MRAAVGPPPRGPQSIGRKPRVALRLAYVVIVALATLTQAGTLAPAAVERSFSDAFQTQLTPRDVVDAARNVVLFAGWGAVWVASAPLGPALPILRDAVLTGALLSVTVETIQLFSDRRHASVLDVLTNTAGALMGAFVLVLLILTVRAARGARSFVGVPAVIFAGAYGAAAVLESFGSLFRQERLPVWGGPMQRLDRALEALDPSSLWVIPWLDVLLFAPAGALAVAALVEMGWRYRSSAAVVAAVGAAAVVGAGFARGLAGYTISYGPMLAHVTGIAAGALVAMRSLPALTPKLRGARRALAFLLFYAFMVALWSWRPLYPEFDPARIAMKLSPERLVPLKAYRERVELATVVDVLLSFLLLVPIGALLAVWPLRLRGWLRSFLPGLYLAAGLEGAQLFIAGRWFDVTDILVHGAAVVLGWVVVRRAGFKPYGELLPPART